MKTVGWVFGCVLTCIGAVALALLAFNQLGDMSRVIHVVPGPDGQQAIVFSQGNPSGNMSMVFLSVGLATERPFPAEESSPRGKVREILAIQWDYKDRPADKVTFKWGSSERLSICTVPGTKIERFDAQIETGYAQIHLCPELLDTR